MVFVLQVLSELGAYLDHYSWESLDQVWLLVCGCLEAGDEHLKATALRAIAALLHSCGLPKNVEVCREFSFPLFFLLNSGWDLHVI